MINERVQGCIADTLTFRDTSMIHFCKAKRKVSFWYLLVCQTIMPEWRLENDTLILSLGKIIHTMTTLPTR